MLAAGLLFKGWKGSGFYVLLEGRRKVVRPKLAYPLRLMGLIINHLTHTPHSMDYIVNTLVASNPPPNTEAFWFPQNKSRVCRLLYKYVSVKVRLVSVWQLIIQFFQKDFFFPIFMDFAWSVCCSIASISCCKDRIVKMVSSSSR
jgi:hypothetical protein